MAGVAVGIGLTEVWRNLVVGAGLSAFLEGVADVVEEGIGSAPSYDAALGLGGGAGCGSGSDGRAACCGDFCGGGGGFTTSS